MARPRTSKEDWLKLAETLSVGNAHALTPIATGLQRPECVLTHSSGRIFVSDKRGGVTTIWPDGRLQLSGESNLLPNGIAMQRDGSFLVANLGPGGGVWRITANGQTAPWMTEVEGKIIDRVNFVSNDSLDRVWVCISATDGSDQYPLHTASGSIILRDASGTRVVAEGLHYTNECRVSADGNFMYVNETFGRRLSRFRIQANGELVAKETIATFNDGDFPDGLTLDADGGAWVVCVGSNRLYRIAPDGEKQTIIDDAFSSVAAELEAAFVAGTLDRPQLSAARGHRLSNITSIAFGGKDLRTAYMGCLAGDSLMSFRSPVAGLAPVHWNW
jgi:sugar lactone lactonase YvrE